MTLVGMLMILRRAGWAVTPTGTLDAIWEREVRGSIVTWRQWDFA